MQSQKLWVQVEVRLAKPHRPCCQLWLSSGAKIVTLDLNLICLRAWPSFWPVPPESVQPCPSQAT